MEGQDKDSRHNRSKQRSSEEREEEHGREGRRKEEKRKKEGKTSSSSSTATTTRQSKQLTQAASGGQGSRYHHREVPPRFQHQKQTKQQKYSKTNQAVNKKPMKDSSRWQQPPQQPQPQPLHHHHHSSHPNHHHPHHHPLPPQSGASWLEDDGGWSEGPPVKGSGWGSDLSGPTSSTDKDRTKSSTLDKDWTSSETVSGTTSAPLLSSGGSSEVTGNRSSAGGEGGGGLWLTLDSRTSDSDAWRSISPGHSSKHSQADNWATSDDNEGSQIVGESAKTGMGPNRSGTSTPGDGGPMNPSESKSSTWAVGSKWDMPDTEPIGEDLDRELATELNCSAGAFSLEEGGSRGEFASSSRSTQEGVSDWDELDTSSLSSNDRDPLAQTLTLNGGTGVGNTGDGKERKKSTQETTTDGSNQGAASVGLSEEQKDYDDPASDGGSTVARSESSSSYGLLHTLSGGDSSGSNSQESPDLSRVGSITDHVWMGGKETPQSLSEGGGGGAWRPTRSSTSSVNSVGSTSSWKSDNGKGSRSYQNRGNISRKPCRFESSSSQSGLNGLKVRKAKKPAMDLEDALESLHSEPSGWGDLPSPKISDNDDGTGIWGEPPDIKSRNGRKSSGGQGPAVNWNDSHYSSPVEWGDDDPSGAIAAGWGGKENPSRTPTSAGGQWVGGGRGGGGGTGGGGSMDGWNTVVSKHKDKTPTFADNLKKLMDMGFPRQASEKYLKANSNDIDAAIGDLLAVTALADDVNGELVNGNGYPLQNNRNKRHGKSLGPSGPVSFQSALSSTSTSSVAGIPSTSNSTLNTTPTGLTPGFNPKDPLYQQLAALQMFGSIPGLQPPLPNQQPNQAQALMQMQLLQQLQQRYLLNQLQLSPMFTPMPNLQSYQQLLTQQLGQLRLMKQQLAQQAKSAAQNPQQQQLLTLRMGQVNQSINQINRQLVIISQISSQQKDATKNQDGGKSTPTGIASPSIGRNTPPIRKGDPNLGGVPLNRSMSANMLGDTGKNLSYGMQGLSLSNSGTSPPPPPPSSAVSQSSARSMSRLQWIISGSANSDNSTSSAVREEKHGSGITTPSSGPFPGFPASSSIPLSSLASPGQGPVHPVAPVYPPAVGLASLPSNTANTVTVSSSHFPAPKSFDDIQEFKPGVPWQPRVQPTEPAQVYPKPPSTMGTFSSGIAFPSGRSNPPFPFSQSNPGGFTKAITPGSGPKVTRQKSGGDGGSGAFFGGYPPPAGMQPFGSQPGSGNKYGGGQSQSRDSRQPWNPLVPDSHGGVPFGQSQSHPYSTHRGSQRTNIRNPPGPFGGPNTNQHPLSSSQPFGNLTTATSGRKQQQPPHFTPPSLVPPTSLPPTQLPYKSNRNFPLGTRAPGNKSQMGHRSLSTPAHMDSRQWGSVVEPPTKSVWGVDNSKQPKWGLDNHMWNVPTSSSEVRPPPSLPSDPSPPSYTSPPSQPNTSSDPYAFTMPSVAPGCWEGLHSPHHESSMLSPDPTFDEWQAGKKARLSVFKLPSNPPSPWLILRNVTSQVDESSLRDVCSECGVIQSCVINSALESALIHYNSSDEAILAKTGLDKNPTICGIDVTSDFASESDIAYFFEQLSISKDEAGVATAGGLNMPSALGEVAQSWFSGPLDRDGPTLPSSSLPSSHTSTVDEGSNKAPSRWDDPPTPFSNDPSTMTGMSGATTTAMSDSSLWSNGSFLPGLPTPWCNSFTRGNQEGEDHSAISGSPSMSTFLPNGLL